MGYLAADFRVKHRDYFNLARFYKVVREYLLEQHWCERADHKFPEIKMHHRYLPNNNQEIRFWWRLEKDISTYFKYSLNIDFKILHVKEVDYLYRGKKFKCNIGECEIKVHARVITDKDNKWEKHWLLKNINEIFWKRFIRGELQTHRVELQREAYRFQDWLKAFFAYPTTLIEPAGQGGFQPQLGIDEY